VAKLQVDNKHLVAKAVGADKAMKKTKILQ
jgi:hypothetical protein